MSNEPIRHRLAQNRSSAGPAWVLAAGLLAGSAAAQDADLPKPSCSAPSVPEQFASSEVQDHFVEAARVYEKCIGDFVAAQQTLSEKHAKAGNAAAEEFNRFAAAAAEVKPPPVR
jgi:hypothetical protein